MKSLLFFFFVIICSTLKSQDIAWYSQDHSSGHIISFKIGADYGTVFGFSYGYKVPGRIPVIVGTEFSTPFGKDFMDDFKTKLTAQTIIWPARHFGIAVKPALTFRRYESSAAILCNIGAELGTSVGYYRDTWGIGAEATYERSSATLIKHRVLKDYYPDIRDDWYASTGGNFKFGMQGHWWMKSTGVSLKAGRIFGQNFSDNPTVPFYADFSVMRKL